MQMTAPMMMVTGTPTIRARAPDMRLPKGIMPPKMSAQMPITRPRIPSGTLVWSAEFDVAMKSIIPNPAPASRGRAA